MIRVLPIVLLLFTSVLVIPRTSAQSSGGLLFEINRNDLPKPSYIFGTIHAICPADLPPAEGLRPYIDRTEQMLMEIDMDDPAEMGSMSKTIFIADGKTLKDFLTAEQFSKVDEVTRNLLGSPAERVKTLKPSILSIMMVASPKALGCTPTVYDLLLMQSAVAKKIPVVGLESVASQLNVLDSQPIYKQAKDLYEMALDPQKRIQELKSLIAIYKTQDAEKLFEYSTKDLSNDQEFQSRLLDDRNRLWVPKIESSIKDKPTFIAVGAAHLGGKNGVVNLLRAKGYTLKPIKISPPTGGGN